MYLRLFAALACVLLLASCAEMRFYDNPQFSGNQTGIKFYTPKPYLLVARTGNKEKPVEVSIVHLPDLANPQYARPVSGFGSSKLSLTLANGFLTSMGQEGDTKITELLTSFGGLAESLATARKTRRETDLLQQSGTVDYVSLSSDLARIAGDIDKQVPVGRANNALSGAEQATLTNIANQLRAASTALSNPGSAPQAAEAAAKILEGVLTSWKQVGAAPAAGAPEVLAMHRMLEQLKKETAGALGKIAPKEAEPPTFTLYEIRPTKNGTELVEVEFPKSK